MNKAFLKFWKENPAFFYGIFFTLGTFAKQSAIFLSLLALIFPLKIKKVCLSCFLIGYLYAPPIPSLKKPQQKAGIFKISHISYYDDYFQKGIIYKGVLNSGSEKIPCLVFEKGHLLRRKANISYKVTGTLFCKKGIFYFTPKFWEKNKKIFSLEELRFLAKEKFKHFLKSTIKNKPSFHLISALITGDIEDNILKLSFSKIGLYHLLAISGFHFSLLTNILHRLFKLCFSPLWQNILLLITVNIYFLFVGPLPSVQRAWIMTQIMLFARLFKKKNSPLNSLGISLFICLLFDPTNILKVGFQLSFLTTATILLAYPSFDKLISSRKKRKSFLKPKIFSFLKRGYLLFFIANLASLPLILFHFQKTTITGLLSNLFFPFLISISLLLFIFCLPFYFLFPLLFSFINSISCKIAEFLLSAAYSFPSSWDLCLRIKALPLTFLFFYFYILFSLLIFLKYRLQNTREFEFLL